MGVSDTLLFLVTLVLSGGRADISFVITVIEPLRSTDGFCGPDHKNATCIGSDFGQCCNAETWKCGQTECVPFLPSFSSPTD